MSKRNQTHNISMRNKSLIELTKTITKQSSLQIFTPMLRQRSEESGLMTHIRPQIHSFVQLFNPFFTSKRVIMQKDSTFSNFSTSVQIGYLKKDNPAHILMKPLMAEGFGWAGQPVVKRIQPIYPEVEGDICDFYIPIKGSELTVNTITNKTIRNDVQDISNENVELKRVKELDSDISSYSLSRPTEALEYNQDNLIETEGDCCDNRTSTKKPEHIININKPIPNEGITNVQTQTQICNENSLPNPLVLKSTETNLVNNNDSVFATHENSDTVPISSRKKLKMKKKTVVLNKNNTIVQNSIKYKTSKNKKIKYFKGSSLKKKIQMPHILNHSVNTNAFTSIDHSNGESGLMIENRQLQTFSPANTSKKISKKSKKKNKYNKNRIINQIADDCVCPEIPIDQLYNKETTICGVATGEEKKQALKKWKPKMCLAVGKPKFKKGRTKMCISKKYEKQKRKKELPKCPKEIKKDIPKVLVCLPNIIDEKLQKKKKVCVKLEEVKLIKDRTLVCKPKIFYGEVNQSQISTEKSVCISKVNRILSRETKICLPSDEENKVKQKIKQ